MKENTELSFSPDAMLLEDLANSIDSLLEVEGNEGVRAARLVYLINFFNTKVDNKLASFECYNMELFHKSCFNEHGLEIFHDIYKEIHEPSIHIDMHLKIYGKSSYFDENTTDGKTIIGIIQDMKDAYSKVFIPFLQGEYEAIKTTHNLDAYLDNSPEMPKCTVDIDQGNNPAEKFGRQKSYSR